MPPAIAIQYHCLYNSFFIIFLECLIPLTLVHFPPLVHHPSASSVKVLTIGMLSCAHAASTAKVGALIASQAAGDLASKSHSTISFLLVLASTISGWILHGANSEMKTGLQKFLKEHSCEGMEGSKKLRKKLSCKAFPAKPQLTSQEALNQSWCF